jgi:hypothetical protein
MGDGSGAVGCRTVELLPTLTQAQECLDAAVAILDETTAAAEHVIAARLYVAAAIEQLPETTE